MTAARFGLLSYPGIANLGDPIQSLAARRFLPQVDVLIERERISAPPGGSAAPVKAILNGWFMHAPENWPPHPAIVPLPVSMHFVEPGVSRLRRWAVNPLDRMLSGAGAEYLRHWGPVGARDRYTLDELHKRDVPAYLSGCLTLTLRRPERPRGEVIVASDLSPAALARLRAASSRPIVAVTHLGGERLDHDQQHSAALGLLETYAGAAAVVTTRIHAAMPCLALGTPVLLLHDGQPKRRVRDVTELVHACSEADFLRGRLDYDWAEPPANPDAFRALIPALEHACRDFTGFDQAAIGQSFPSASR